MDRFELLATLIASEGWRKALIPHLTAQFNADIVSLVNPTTDRKVSDDFVRGRISILRWLIEGIQKELLEVRIERQAQEAAKNGGQPIGTGDPYGEQEK